MATGFTESEDLWNNPLQNSCKQRLNEIATQSIKKVRRRSKLMFGNSF